MKKKIIVNLVVFIITSSSAIHSQWNLQNYDTNYALSNLYFINENTGFAGGEGVDLSNFQYKGVIYKTSNAGTNWNIVFLDTNIIIWHITFTNENTGFAVGGLYSHQPKIIRTTNAGINWNYVPPNGINEKINSFNIYGQTIYATCAYGIFKSNNGGLSWTKILIFNYSYYSCSYFFDIDNFITCGGNGTIYRTSDGGNSWSQTELDYMEPHDIEFVDENTGFFISDSSSSHNRSKLHKTINGGMNWSELDIPANMHFWSIHFVNAQTGFVTGSGSINNIFKTTNTGETWFSIFTGEYLSLNDIKFINKSTGYTCGSDALIFKTTTGGVIGIEPISTEIPDEFTLYQNYPNPFNPTTNIKFSIPKAAFVTITVYDMLGRQIQTLVNENLSPATYEVKWDAAGFSSGIYFYKLLTPDFSLVKKMSVIK